MGNNWTNWRGDEAERMVLDCCNDAIDQTLNAIGNMTDSIIPLDEGPLMNSRYSEVKKSGKKVTGILSYGGGSGTGKPKLPYAIRWHENTANFQHGRQSNYLRGPFQRIAKVKLKEFVSESLRSRF